MTLAQAEQIRTDPARIEAAAKAASELAEEQAAQLAAQLAGLRKAAATYDSIKKTRTGSSKGGAKPSSFWS